MSGNELLVAHDGPVATITLDRPKVHNALNSATLRGLAEEIRRLTASGAGAIVLTGAGEKAFSAGADLDELAGLDAHRAQEILGEGQRILAAIEHSPVPVIAAVNGLALGGGFELVLASTFSVLSQRASFGLPESGLGLIPGYGGTQRLRRVVGTPVAAHVMLSGNRLSAQRAYELGLSPLEPVEPGELLPTAVKLAGDIAARGPRAHVAILRALRVGAPTEAELAYETSLAAIATGGAEAAEGIEAFKQRRAPEFPSVTRENR
ncbi:enoyl-CoA hydratase/isomerase family protein [Amycolatopsis acidicola]|uniref:Enoyl-CoA hydratase/isomerase family protein n=1 Tax=Amycolatopsis acidicola TaxID=2596893 RepID=A0A5N0VF39_9PSEU|nr:enoyl-CoA hydratase/isomerase family protein [Amycolatopsis acidicola]KAA9163302.1 enoyl-CoA hydratase/isomerase family protein [Amycolatopsis acidicola]